MGEAHLMQAISRSLRRHALASVVLIVTLFGGAGYWVTHASIHGAVIASGRFVVETKVKRIQHADGGYVERILIDEGDLVGEGELLVLLDDTILRADLAVVSTQLNEAVLTEARLLAQQLGESSFVVPEAELVATEGRAIRRIIRAQQRLLEASRRNVEGQKKQLEQQIAQLREQIAGLALQQNSKSEEIGLVEEELGNIEKLLERGLITQERVKLLQRERASLQGERGKFVAEIAQARLAISEKELQILRVNDDELATILQQVQDTRLRKSQYSQQRITYLKQLQRLEIRAPQDGIVHELAVHMVGAVVKPGDMIVSLVPRQDELVIEARIDPQDVDQIQAGQAATIRLLSLNQRLTPNLEGEVVSVSPDVAVDPATQIPYYKVRLALAEDELQTLGEGILVAGMPVEAFIRTRERTVASFLIQPLTDQIAKTFREE